MHINFDQIFSSSTELPSKDSFDSTLPGSDFTPHNKTLHAAVAQFHIESSLKKRDSPSKFRHILQTTSSQDASYDYQWFKKSVNEQPLISRNQKSNKKQALSPQKTKQLISRLSKPGHHCTKKQCRKDKKYQIGRLLQKEILPIGCKKSHNRSLTQTCELIKKNPSSLHQKLYQETFHFAFNKKQQKLQADSKTNTNPQLLPNKQYDDKYVKFFTRLSQEVQKKQLKQIYYQEKLQLRNATFEPNCSASKRSKKAALAAPTITPKTQRKQYHSGSSFAFSQVRKLNNSTQSLLNKSKKIVDNQTNKVISKLCDIFDNDGIFELTPYAIGSLSETEFNILFPLITELEGQEDLPIQRFEKIVRNYYEVLIRLFQYLPNIDKHALKSPKAPPKPIEKKTPSQTAKQKSINQRRTSALGDYLTKISNFV